MTTPVEESALVKKYRRAMRNYHRLYAFVMIWTLSFFVWLSSMAWLRSPTFVIGWFAVLIIGNLTIVWNVRSWERRYHRIRRVVRVRTWAKDGLRFSHQRAWYDWPDESKLPEKIRVRQWVERNLT